MSVTLDRKCMQQALREFVVPRVRAMGFVGAFPHFLRKAGVEYQMLMIGFNKYGGSFYVEAGRISESGFLTLQQQWKTAGKELSDGDLTVGHCGWKDRVRIGDSQLSRDADHWFKFGPDRLSAESHGERPDLHYQEVALQAARCLDAEVEVFFENAL